VLGFHIYRVDKLKKVILPQGREHKAAGLDWVLGIGDWVLRYLNPKSSTNSCPVEFYSYGAKNPTNSIR